MIHLLRRAPTGGPDTRAQEKDELARLVADSEKRKAQTAEQITYFRSALRHLKAGGDLDFGCQLAGKTPTELAALFGVDLPAVDTAIAQQQQSLAQIETELRVLRREHEAALTMRRVLRELIRQLTRD